jgi:hypothetical protein
MYHMVNLLDYKLFNSIDIFRIDFSEYSYEMSVSTKLPRNPCEGLCDIYIMYFDEERGHVPLLIYPEEINKDNKVFMRPIKYHPIWFLTVDEQEALDHIDLEFKGYTFFGKKFLTYSKRKKRRAGLEEETPETIVIIISLPNDIEIFGDDLIRALTTKIKEKFNESLFELIECECAKDEIIKTSKMKKIIEEGHVIKDELYLDISNICKNYFSSVIKETDLTSLKQQKAISFLALKGIDVSHLISDEEQGAFSNINLFDPLKKDKETLRFKQKLKIEDIEVIEDSNELEILVKNNTEKELDDLIVKITHVKEFFEKEIMNQRIDAWFPEEELLFISPIIPHINEYLFFIIEEEGNKRILAQKIDLNLLDHHK